MRVSVCLITRNEEHNLPRALASVRGVADEIVVADTGSTDRTVDIARDAGAIVSHFTWCDDFSAARNHALEQATGDWIFWLDADEELLASSRDLLLAAVTLERALGYCVLRQDLVRADDLNTYTCMWQLRLFRRDPRLRFVGRCHPEFRPRIDAVAAEDGRQVLDSAITLRHYGYVAAMKPSKLQRAARLLQLELDDRPGQLYYQIELGRTLLALGDERGHEVLTEATGQIVPRMAAVAAPMPLVAPLLEYLMQLPADRLPHGLTPAQVRSLAQRWFPRSAPLLWLLAREAFDAGRFAQSESLLRLLVTMGREQSYDLHVSFDPRFVGADAVLNLGVCLVRQAKLAEAEQHFRSLLADPVHGAAAGQNLAAIRQISTPAAKPDTRRRPRRGSK